MLCSFALDALGGGGAGQIGAVQGDVFFNV